MFSRRDQESAGGVETYNADGGHGVAVEDAGEDHGQHLPDGHHDGEDDGAELLDGEEDEELAHGLFGVRVGVVGVRVGRQGWRRGQDTCNTSTSTRSGLTKTREHHHGQS